MRIKSCEGQGYAIETEEIHAWVPERQGCFASGFIEAEVAAAEASPGDWIDCPRDEPARPKQHCRCCVVLTRGRDALLTVCKKLRRGDLPEREQPLWDEMQTAIAIAEPTE